MERLASRATRSRRGTRASPADLCCHLHGRRVEARINRVEVLLRGDGSSSRGLGSARLAKHGSLALFGICTIRTSYHAANATKPTPPVSLPPIEAYAASSSGAASGSPIVSLNLPSSSLLINPLWSESAMSKSSFIFASLSRSFAAFLMSSASRCGPSGAFVDDLLESRFKQRVQLLRFNVGLGLLRSGWIGGDGHRFGHDDGGRSGRQ